MNREQWAQGFLAYAGWEISREKVIALVAQAQGENSEALANPLDTEEDAPGAVNYNTAGVKSYPSLEVGYGATLATFTNGFYPELVAQLSDPNGGSSIAYASSVNLNTWGTGNVVAEVEEIKSGDPNGYLGIEVAGTGAGPTPAPGPGPSPEPPKPPEGVNDVNTAVETVNGIDVLVQIAPDGTVYHKVRSGATPWSEATNGVFDQKALLGTLVIRVAGEVPSQQLQVFYQQPTDGHVIIQATSDGISWGDNQLP